MLYPISFRPILEILYLNDKKIKLISKLLISRMKLHNPKRTQHPSLPQIPFLANFANSLANMRTLII